MGIVVKILGRRKEVEDDFPPKDFSHLYRK
jgi:hypothetical protein